MEPRLNYVKAAPEALKAMYVINSYVKNCGLEYSLLELVKIRASQLNNCAYCLDMHTKDARLAGETEQRIYCLSAWRETSFYTDRERAALAWTEALTLLPQNEVSDELYAEIQQHFTEEEQVNLSMAVIVIN